MNAMLEPRAGTLLKTFVLPAAVSSRPQVERCRAIRCRAIKALSDIRRHVSDLVWSKLCGSSRDTYTIRAESVALWTSVPVAVGIYRLCLL
jgi:hypothetical protein